MCVQYVQRHPSQIIALFRDFFRHMKIKEAVYALSFSQLFSALN